VTYAAVSALTHVGLLRDANEDSLVIGPWTICGGVTETPQTLVFPLGTPLLVAVADGLGGHPGGEVASALVVRELAEAGVTIEDEETLRRVLADCNQAVYDAAEGELFAMGTTVAGLVLTAEQVLVFNVGDSRVYFSGPDGVRQVSVDDRPPVGPGERTSTVTQTLGGQFTAAPVDPHLWRSSLAGQMRFLVCTDGVSDVVPEGRLAEILLEHDDGRAAFELWKAAMEGGGPDNVTLAVVRIVEQ
jgi:PPM family protein phosphatase